MNTATIKVRSDLKDKVQLVADAHNISIESIVNSILKYIIKTKKITFTEDEKPNEYFKAIMQQAEKDYKKGNTSPRFKKAEDFIEFLHKEAA